MAVLRQLSNMLRAFKNAKSTEQVKPHGVERLSDDEAALRAEVEKNHVGRGMGGFG